MDSSLICLHLLPEGKTNGDVWDGTGPELEFAVSVLARNRERQVRPPAHIARPSRLTPAFYCSDEVAPSLTLPNSLLKGLSAG